MARYQSRRSGLTVVRVPTHRPIDRKRPLFGAPEGGWYRRRLHLSWLPRTRPEARFRPPRRDGLPGPSCACWTGARSSASRRSSCARASTSSTSGCRFPTSASPSTSAAGVQRYQRKKLHFGFLEVAVDAELIRRERPGDDRRGARGLGRSAAPLPAGLPRGPGAAQGPRRAAGTTFKVAFDADGERLAVYLYDVRMYGFSPTPAAQRSAVLSRAVAERAAALPDVERARGQRLLHARAARSWCQLAAVSARLQDALARRRAPGRASRSPRTGLRLRFAAGGLPPPALLDEELLLTLEGARAFAEAEALVAAGQARRGARRVPARSRDAEEAHPFAAGAAARAARRRPRPRTS